MKIRKSFVSNSSSSSFVIWGADFSTSYVKSLFPAGHDDDDDDNYDMYDFMKDFNGKYCQDNYDDVVYAGLSPNEMHDDETLSQFKQRVADMLEKKFKMCPEITYIQGVDTEDGLSIE